MKVLATAVLLVGLVFTGCADPASETQEAGEEAEASPAVETSVEPSEPAQQPDNLVAATQFRFNTDEIELTSDERNELPFVNNDPAPHNIAIYIKEGGKDLFVGKPVGEGESITYRVPPLKKGRYYFVCDLHPVMEGTVVVQ